MAQCKNIPLCKSQAPPFEPTSVTTSVRDAQRLTNTPSHPRPRPKNPHFASAASSERFQPSPSRRPHCYSFARVGLPSCGACGARFFFHLPVFVCSSPLLLAFGEDPLEGPRGHAHPRLPRPKLPTALPYHRDRRLLGSRRSKTELPCGGERRAPQVGPGWHVSSRKSLHRIRAAT